MLKNKISLKELKNFYYELNFNSLLNYFYSELIDIETSLYVKSSDLFYIKDMFSLLNLDDKPLGSYSFKIENYILYLNSENISVFDDLVYLLKIQLLNGNKDKLNQKDLSTMHFYIQMQMKYLLFKRIRKTNQLILRNLDSYSLTDYYSFAPTHCLMQYNDYSSLEDIFKDRYLTYLFNLIIQVPSLNQRSKILNIATITLKKREEPIWQSLKKMLSNS